jgi:hypothetical protein
MNKPPQLNMPREIDLTLTIPVECDECKGQAFQQAMMLRKVSALLSGNGEEGFMPVMVFACVKCGHINNEFIPVEIRPKPAIKLS